LLCAVEENMERKLTSLFGYLGFKLILNT
jgi:hypothetical protein